MSRMQPPSRSSVQAFPAGRLRVRLGGPDPAGGRVVQLDGLVADRCGAQVPGVDEVPQRIAVHGADRRVEQAAPVQLAEDRRDAARPVHVLDVVIAARRDLAQAGHPPGHLVDLLEAEVHARLVRRGQQVQDRVGRPAHRHVQGHRVLERVAAGDGARQCGFVAVGVVLRGQLDDRRPGPLEQAAPRGVRGQRGPVARQREADRLRQAVHRVGGEHARAGAARRAGSLLHLEQFGIGHRRVGRGDHRVDEVELAAARGRPRPPAGPLPSGRRRRTRSGCSAAWPRSACRA